MRGSRREDWDMIVTVEIDTRNFSVPSGESQEIARILHEVAARFEHNADRLACKLQGLNGENVGYIGWRA